MKMSVVKMWIFAMIMLIVRTFQVVIDVPAEKDMLKLLKVVKVIGRLLPILPLDVKADSYLTLLTMVVDA